MKINLKLSKLIPAAQKMPKLKHKVELVDGKWVRDSEVLRWLATNEDLVMWMMCILRAGGVIVRDVDGDFIGDPSWDGTNKIFKDRNKRSRERLRRMGKKAGRSKSYDLTIITDALDHRPLSAQDLERMCVDEVDMSRSTFFRLMKECRERKLIHYDFKTHLWMTAEAAVISYTTCHSGDCTTASPPPSATS